MANVVLERIHKSFGAVAAVDDVTLEIPDEKFTVFLGPSGCGKTTCLRMIAGLEEPTSGRILIGGRDVTLVPPRDRDIAMVFQNYALYPHMSVRQNLEMGLRFRKLSTPEVGERVNETARLLGLEALLDRRPGQLSGGQSQRVAVGRAIVRHPQVFLMDEPLSNLDMKLRAQMRTELKLLHRRLRTTTVFVTHDQLEAMTMAHLIAVMNEGRLLQLDTPDRVFNAPANRFVAEFVGAPQMNFLKGRLEREDGDLFVTTVAFRIRVGAEASRELEAANAKAGIDVAIRPQAVNLATNPDGALARGTIQVLEPIGTQIHVHLFLDQLPFVVVADSSFAAEADQTVGVNFAAQDLYLFDSLTGEALIHGV